MTEPLKIEVHVGKRVRVDLAFLKADGTPGKIDGQPFVSYDAGNPAADPFKPTDDPHVVYFRGLAGNVDVALTGQVEGDADLGAGVSLLGLPFELTTLDSDVTSLTGTVGAEEDDPDATAPAT